MQLVPDPSPHQIENETLTGKLVDLPCIVECQKTIDNKTFYKSGDICQMLLVCLNLRDQVTDYNLRDQVTDYNQ